MVTENTPASVVADLIHYDGIYHKITAHDIECGCFCSLGSCVKNFDTIGEIVIETYSNLFHIQCFGEKHNIKKPELTNVSQFR